MQGRDGTTINGLDQQFVAFASMTTIGDDLIARLGAGDDQLNLDGVSVSGSALIVTHQGDNRVELGNTTISRNLRIRTSDGNDAVSVDGVTVSGWASIATRRGDDSVTLIDSTVDRNLSIRTSDGNDTVYLEDVTVSGWTSVLTHRGDDNVGFENTTIERNLRIHTSRGSDAVNLQGVTANNDVRIVTSTDDDTIRIADSTIGDDIALAAGSHDDVVVIDTTGVGDAVWLSSDTGDDDFAVMDSNIGGNLRAGMSAGDDFAFIDPTQVAGRVAIRTHRGQDTVLIEGANQLGGLNVHTGSGDDSLQVDPLTAVDRVTRTRGEESTTVTDEERDDQLNNPTSGALTRSEEVAMFFRELNPSDQPFTLTVDVSSNTTVESSDTLITNDSDFVLDVMTQPNAVVSLDTDNDGQFDDGTATADASGNASLLVALTHNDTNNGANTVRIQATNGVDTPLMETVDVHFATGTIVRFDISLGSWDVELLDDDAPATVGAFLDDLERHTDSIIHRNVDGFIVQGGGFETDGSSDVDRVPGFASPPNEFNLANPANSNLRGTLSTAQTSDINSFSGQWLVNTIDNDATSPFNNLDNVPHTVFGRVIGTGMMVVDEINNTPVFDVRSLVGGTGASALQQAPLVNYTQGTLPTADNYIRMNSVSQILEPPGRENTFRLSEIADVGDVVGTVMPLMQMTSPVIYQFDDPTLASELTLNGDDHLEGNAAAPVVILEYLSLQCPLCAAAHSDIKQLLLDNPQDVVVVRRHLPLDDSMGAGFQHSFEAALAAEAAGRQGMFDEMVDQLFARQSEFSNAAISEQAQAVFEDIATHTLGLDAAQFSNDMADNALADRINRDVTDAGVLGVTATPTWFLNGQQTTGTPTNADVQNAIQSISQPFALDRRTGELTVADNSNLDFETDPTITFDVIASNGTTELVDVVVELFDVFNR